MAAPSAYFISFRTYGTWLPGDQRGTADRGQRAYGEPHAPRDDQLRAYAQRRMTHSPVTLSELMRRVVAATVASVCEDRSWFLSALNVRTNHVHLVITAPESPEFVMNRLKSSSTAALRRQGLAPPALRLWSRHGSTRYLWTDDDVDRASDYTLNHQD